jgi:uncharacterized alpha-E superfamily protein
MLSRVAESIYWMSRYVERAENIARTIEANFNLALDVGPDMGNQWDPLICTTGDHAEFYLRYDKASQRNVIEFLTFDEENPNSIISCLTAARENARTIRDMISSQMWEELNKFYLMVRAAQHDEYVLLAPFEFLGKVKLGGSILEGVAESTMSRGESWHFRRLGLALERADKTSRLLDVKYYLLLPQASDVGTPADSNQWAALLRSVSALEMYRKAYGRITPAQVAEFLILDRDFPRSLHFCLIHAEQSLLAISGGSPGTFRTPAEQYIGRLRAELDYGNMDDIISSGLHEYIDGFQRQLNSLGEAIAETFFATPAQHGEPHVTLTRSNSGRSQATTMTRGAMSPVNGFAK